MTALCASAFKGKVARVITLDTCGNPVTGASSSVISTGFISVKFTPQYEDGTEYTEKDANGVLCVNELGDSQLKYFEVEAKFCVLNPDISVVIGGGRLLSSSATGVGAAFGSNSSPAHFSIEVWQDVSGTAACDASGNPQYVYWVATHCFDGKLSDYTVEDGVSSFTVTAKTKSVGPQWGTGPGSDGPWLAEALVSGDHLAWNITSTAPPTATCGAVVLA